MENEAYKARIGDDKLLIYHPDPSRETDLEFVHQLQQVAVTKPQTLQEFFIRLNELQKESFHQNISTMQIEMKNIKVAHHQSEETIAFTADPFINNNKVAFVKNEGKGGNTHYQLYKSEDKPLLRQAEEYCKKQSLVVFSGAPDENITIPMNLERHIDQLLKVHLQKKDLNNFNRKLKRYQQYGIAYGIPEKKYNVLKFALPLKNMLEEPEKLKLVKAAIRDFVLPMLNEGEKILNTNLDSR